MIYVVDSRGRIAAMTVHEYTALSVQQLTLTRVFFSPADAFAHAATVKKETQCRN